MDAHCVGKSVFWGAKVDETRLAPPGVRRANSLDRRGSTPAIPVRDRKKFYLGACDSGFFFCVVVVGEGSFHTGSDEHGFCCEMLV